MKEISVTMPDYMSSFHYVQFGDTRIKNAGFAKESEAFDPETSKAMTECILSVADFMGDFGWDVDATAKEMMMCAENHPDEFPRPNEKLLKIVAYLAWLLYCPEEKKKAPVSPTKETTDANQQNSRNRPLWLLYHGGRPESRREIKIWILDVELSAAFRLSAIAE